MQTASLALEASRASQLQCVHSELQRFWHKAAEISGKVWALLGGPMADNRARRLTQALQPLQAPGCREMDADERLELETLLLELVCSFAAAEMVTAVAESLLNRLPNNTALVASMMECLLCASTRPPAVCSSLGMWRKWQLQCGRLLEPCITRPAQFVWLPSKVARNVSRALSPAVVVHLQVAKRMPEHYMNCAIDHRVSFLAVSHSPKPERRTQIEENAQVDRWPVSSTHC
jgi:hypothetical protein